MFSHYGDTQYQSLDNDFSSVDYFQDDDYPEDDTPVVSTGRSFPVITNISVEEVFGQIRTGPGADLHRLAALYGSDFATVLGVPGYYNEGAHARVAASFEDVSFDLPKSSTRSKSAPLFCEGSVKELIVVKQATPAVCDNPDDPCQAALIEPLAAMDYAAAKYFLPPLRYTPSDVGTEPVGQCIAFRDASACNWICGVYPHIKREFASKLLIGYRPAYVESSQKVDVPVVPVMDPLRISGLIDSLVASFVDTTGAVQFHYDFGEISFVNSLGHKLLLTPQAAICQFENTLDEVTTTYRMAFQVDGFVPLVCGACGGPQTPHHSTAEFITSFGRAAPFTVVHCANCNVATCIQPRLVNGGGSLTIFMNMYPFPTFGNAYAQVARLFAANLRRSTGECVVISTTRYEFWCYDKGPGGTWITFMGNFDKLIPNIPSRGQYVVRHRAGEACAWYSDKHLFQYISGVSNGVTVPYLVRRWDHNIFFYAQGVSNTVFGAEMLALMLHYRRLKATAVYERQRLKKKLTNNKIYGRSLAHCSFWVRNDATHADLIEWFADRNVVFNVPGVVSGRNSYGTNVDGSPFGTVGVEWLHIVKFAMLTEGFVCESGALPDTLTISPLEVHGPCYCGDKNLDVYNVNNHHFY
jgi:hypothetical protein